MSPATAPDLLTVEIVRQRLTSITEEAEAIILRTAYSASIAEALDFASAIFDSDGKLLAQTKRSQGSFVGTLGYGLANLLKFFPPETLAPGDTLITNDPWLGAGHLPDIITIRPVFADDRIVAYATNVAHVSDIGGKPSAEAADVFEEGLQIPPSKLYSGDVVNEQILSFIRANSRLPTQVVGDVQAQHAANALIESRLVTLLGEYALPDLDGIARELHSRAEQAVRQRIKALPDGVYRGEAYSDGPEGLITLKATVVISGEDVSVDFDGTSPEIKWGLNVPFSLTWAQGMHALALALVPDLPVVGGTMAAFSVTAPEGSILNPRRPAPTMIRVTVAHNIYAAIYAALEPLIGTAIPAENIHAHFGGIWALRFRGAYHSVPSAYRNGGPPQINESFAEVYFFNGGTGAIGGMDGQTATSMPVNIANIPVEVMEARTPVIYERKAITPDTGGPGQYRGGHGQEVRIRVLSDSPIDFVPGTNDRTEKHPMGLMGGGEGRGGGIWVGGTPVHRRKATPVVRDQVVTMAIPGGGGWGDPALRAKEAIDADVQQGYVTADAAARDYPSWQL